MRPSSSPGSNPGSGVRLGRNELVARHEDRARGGLSDTQPGTSRCCEECQLARTQLDAVPDEHVALRPDRRPRAGCVVPASVDASIETCPPFSSVTSTMTIASAPSGSGAPVMMRIAVPGRTFSIGGLPRPHLSGQLQHDGILGRGRGDRPWRSPRIHPSRSCRSEGVGAAHRRAPARTCPARHQPAIPPAPPDGSRPGRGRVPHRRTASSRYDASELVRT